MKLRNLNRPIVSSGSVDGWKTLPIVECGEPLVALGAFGSYPQIATDSMYFGERRSSPYQIGQLRNATLAVFVRERVARRLAKAARLLPIGCMLLVWDGYRHLSVQRSLFDDYVAVLEGKGIPHDQAVVDAQTFVSIPSNDPTRPPPHNTGGAVDLTVIRFSKEDWREMRRLTAIVRQPETKANWQSIYDAEMRRQWLIREASVPLGMGTVFDGVHPATATLFYEELDPALLDDRARASRDNRRILWSVMIAAGFSNYGEEWWHFDVGNQFHMARTGERAAYGPAVLSPENEAWEAMRRGHYAGTVAMIEFKCRVDGADELSSFVHSVARRTGHPRDTTHPLAARL